MYRAIDRILKEIVEIEARLDKLEGKSTTSNSSDSNRKAIFHSLNIGEDHSNNSKSLDRTLENASDLIIEHYRRQPPKRQ